SNAVSGRGERGSSATRNLSSVRPYGSYGGGYERSGSVRHVSANERAEARAWSGRAMPVPDSPMRGSHIEGSSQQIDLEVVTNEDGSTSPILWPEIATARVIGQLWGEFLVVEVSGEEFFIIDQHGAAERVRFEELKRRYNSGNRLPSQYLLIPERLELLPEEVEPLKGALEELTRLGFEVVEFGASGTTYLIKAVPDILGSKDNKRLVKDLVEELAAFDGSAKVTEAMESVLMRIACHSVIRGARALTDTEAQALLMDIAKVDFSARCPHGRVVVKSFSRAEMDKIFGRS
ncbi:MAG: hypothetical protein KAS88_05615, partial [Deltaproteobacteria bacterium]|nr:hypothetical protein [Deltaproteobacteria bacterium]